MEQLTCTPGATYSGSLSRYHGYTVTWLTDCTCSDCILLHPHNPERRVDALVARGPDSMLLHHARRTSFTATEATNRHDGREAA